jgi:hypothetical protein
MPVSKAILLRKFMESPSSAAALGNVSSVVESALIIVRSVSPVYAVCPGLTAVRVGRHTPIFKLNA